jgi:hypothetical protein
MGSFAMNYRRILLALGFVAVLARPAPAGILFGKQTKPNPAERVSQLLVTLTTDSDENKRERAAKELREFDPKAFPQMMPILIDVLKRDQKAAVRVEVVQTLGKLRPISQEAGMALEATLADPSWRVRWQARQTLLGYRISGYKSPPKPDDTSHPAPPGGKPSTNSAPAGQPVKRGLFSTTPKTGPSLVPKETPPPPLADPAPAKPPSAPAPKGSSTPAPAPSEEGPDLPSIN